ncbi:hypothetical protein TNCV_2153611 [Trichonephila clavipes]|nr:hypothetical protein TNCV_2153611 [Trichonephila clavipes]
MALNKKERVLLVKIFYQNGSNCSTITWNDAIFLLVLFFETPLLSGPKCCSVTGTSYDVMLKVPLIPPLQKRHCLEITIFMHNGAPPLIAKPVKNCYKIPLYLLCSANNIAPKSVLNNAELKQFKVFKKCVYKEGEKCFKERGYPS